jgi:hypothetical protein
VLELTKQFEPTLPIKNIVDHVIKEQYAAYRAAN